MWLFEFHINESPEKKMTLTSHPVAQGVQYSSAYVRNSIKSSRADSHVRLFRTANILEADSVSIIMVMEIELVSHMFPVLHFVAIKAASHICKEFFLLTCVCFRHAKVS
jgi:hypothetical protein